LKSLFVGAAGVVLALDMLRRRGHAETRLDLTEAATRALEAWRETPDLQPGECLPESAEASLLCGESGLLLVAWRLAPSTALADALFERVRSNVRNDAYEVMWGSPGTMLAARAMLEWTGEQRWADAWQESADELRRRREPDGLWTHRLFGHVFRDLGPVHGAVGNVLALLAGGADETLERETNELLARTAEVEDGLANWRDGAQFLVQWCHGAPGVVVSAAPYLDEELLLAGAELTWRAGPHGPEKGHGLCHGTAGNGYAFLKTFERTGDELWLDRARRFAVHGLGQVEQAITRRGRGRYSLWTGDVGVALFAAACLDSRTAYPVMDSWDG
jgi:lantibiotic modifying enzyme